MMHQVMKNDRRLGPLATSVNRFPGLQMAWLYIVCISHTMTERNKQDHVQHRVTVADNLTVQLICNPLNLRFILLQRIPTCKKLSLIKVLGAKGEKAFGDTTALERCSQTSIGYSQPKLLVSSSILISYHATRSFKLMGADRWSQAQSKKSHVLLTNFDKVQTGRSVWVQK